MLMFTNDAPISEDDEVVCEGGVEGNPFPLIKEVSIKMKWWSMKGQGVILTPPSPRLRVWN